jgi:hypothetical protein
LDAELDMVRQVDLRARGFTALLASLIIWMQQDHRAFKHPRRSIDLDQQEFRLPHYSLTTIRCRR